MLEYAKERFNKYNEVRGMLIDETILALAGCATTDELRSKSKVFLKDKAIALKAFARNIALEELKDDRLFLLES